MLFLKKCRIILVNVVDFFKFIILIMFDFLKIFFLMLDGIKFLGIEVLKGMLGLLDMFIFINFCSLELLLFIGSGLNDRDVKLLMNGIGNGLVIKELRLLVNCFIDIIVNYLVDFFGILFFF